MSSRTWMKRRSGAGKRRAPGVHGDQVAGPGGGVEPAEPGFSSFISAVEPSAAASCCRGLDRPCSCLSVRDELPRPGGDDAVAGYPGGFAVALEEGAVGHDELELDAGDAAGGAGSPFDQSVGLDLAAGARVPAGPEGVGAPGQRGVDGDALVDGQQRRQVGHAVRGRTQAHGPLGRGVAGALGDGAGVPADGGGPHRGDDGPGPGAAEGSGVGGEFLVNGGPVFDTQAGRLFHDGMARLR